MARVKVDLYDAYEEVAARLRREAFERAMSNTGRPGIFNDHNCSRCQNGELPCVSGRSSTCEFPHARND